MKDKPIFLTAEWRNLAMLNFAADPHVLYPLVPQGAELDSFDDVTYLTVVGFQFLQTRVLGCRVPFCVNFEEVNLRFYVRCRSDEGWRRGVVFVRELVPRRLISLVARAVYGESYVSYPMRHLISEDGGRRRAEYRWQRKGEWESLYVEGVEPFREIDQGTKEEFIADHYWGYTLRARGRAEYHVEHPRWRIQRSSRAELRADVSSLYGAPFAEFLSAEPLFAFIAQGSEVTVRRGRIVTERL